MTYIATTVSGRGYLVPVDGVVVAGPFATVAEAVNAREELGEKKSAPNSQIHEN
jgi:hypothetical protein